MCASLGGMTSPFLRVAMVSAQKVVEVIGLIKKQIEATMFAAGADNLNAIKNLGFEKS